MDSGTDAMRVGEEKEIAAVAPVTKAATQTLPWSVDLQKQIVEHEDRVYSIQEARGWSAEPDL